MQSQQLPLLTPLRVIQTIHDNVRLPHICLVYNPYSKNSKRNHSGRLLLQSISKTIAQYKITHWLHTCTSMDDMLSHVRQLLQILYSQNQQAQQQQSQNNDDESRNIKPICNIVLCALSENEPEITRTLRGMLSHSQNLICINYFFMTESSKQQVESLCKKLEQGKEKKQTQQLPKISTYIMQQNNLKQVIRVLWLSQTKSILYQVHRCFTAIRYQQYTYVSSIAQPILIMLPFKLNTQFNIQNQYEAHAKISNMFDCLQYISDVELDQVNNQNQECSRLYNLASNSFNSLTNAAGLGKVFQTDVNKLDFCSYWSKDSLKQLVDRLMAKGCGMDTLGYLKSIIWSMNRHRIEYLSQTHRNTQSQLLYCRISHCQLPQLQSGQQLITLTYLFASTVDPENKPDLLLILEEQPNNFIIGLKGRQEYVIWPLSILEVQEISPTEEWVRLKWVGHYSQTTQNQQAPREQKIMHDHAEEIMCRTRLEYLLPGFVMKFQAPLTNICIKVEFQYANLTRDQQLQCNECLYQIGKFQQKCNRKINALYCFKVLHHLQSQLYFQQACQQVSRDHMSQDINAYCEVCELVAQSYDSLEQYHKSVETIQSCLLHFPILYDYQSWLQVNMIKLFTLEHKWNQFTTMQLRLLKLYIKYSTKLNNAEISYDLLNPILSTLKQLKLSQSTAYNPQIFQMYSDFLFLKSELIQNQFKFKKQMYSLEHLAKNQKQQCALLMEDLQAHLQQHNKQFVEVNRSQLAIILCMFQLQCTFHDFGIVNQRYQQIICFVNQNKLKTEAGAILKFEIEIKLTFAQFLEKQSKFQQCIQIYEQTRENLDEYAELIHSSSAIDQGQNQWILDKLKLTYQRFALLFYKLKSYESSLQVFEQYLADCVEDNVQIDYKQFIGIRK